MSKLVNLCPHPVTFQRLNAQGRAETIHIQPEANPCRVSTEQFDTGEISGVAVQCQTYGEITNLPAPEPGTTFIVSGIVLNALRIRGIHRPDIIAPATGPRDGALRNGTGKIVAVTRFNGLMLSNMEQAMKGAAA